MSDEMSNVIDECRGAFGVNGDISYRTAKAILRWYKVDAEPTDVGTLAYVVKLKKQAVSSDARLCLEMLYRWVWRNMSK